jgi:hypothetical protein
MKKNFIALTGLIIFIVAVCSYFIVFSQDKNSIAATPENNYVDAEVMIHWNGFGKWMSAEIDLGTSLNIVDNERDEIQNIVNELKNAVDFVNYLNDKGINQ